jgi:hypothetical protein
MTTLVTLTEKEVQELIWKSNKYNKIEEAVGKFYDEDNPQQGDLSDIGEVVATILGYL